MKNQSKFLLATAVLALSAPVGASAGHMLVDEDGYNVVLHGENQGVKDSHGNYVRTKWKGQNGHKNCKCKEEAKAERWMHSCRVYFAFNKAEFTAAGIKVVKDSVDAAKSQSEKVHFTLVGHTDSVGSNEYNLKLSEHRAQAVKHALIKHGINEDEITIKAVGKHHLLVDTADNVREAKNRAVEVTLEIMDDNYPEPTEKY